MNEKSDINYERQIDELSTLESICGENEFCYSVNEDIPTGYADISVVISPLKVYYPEPGKSNISSITLSYLPAIRLNFQLPIEYPSSQSPRFSISCSWLSYNHLVDLCQELDNIWNRDLGEEVLYKWIQFLKYETIQYLKIKEINLMQRKSSISSKTSITTEYEKENCTANIEKETTELDSTKNLLNKTSEDCRVIREKCSDTLITSLKEYNEKCLQQEFDLSYVYCEICYTTNSGIHSMKFSCNHAFCKACATEYLLTKIKDGNVINIICPAIDCKQEINVQQIKNLVPPQVFVTYEKLLLDKTLDSMMDIVYCPRVVCQYPVTYNPLETVASCPNCLYSFCILCKRVYHGVEPCRLKKDEKLDVINGYKNGTEEQQMAIKKRYGELYIKRLLEDHASEETISNSTKACPTCSVQIEKSDGCNKMTCNRCKAFFCYICLSVLDTSNPYDHFANPASPCFNKLFPHERMEEDEEIFWDDIPIF